MNFIEIVKLVIQLLPLLIEAIKTVESAFPGAGQGPMKLDIIKTTLEQSSKAATGLSVSFDNIWPILLKIIDGLVATFNKTGVFKK